VSIVFMMAGKLPPPLFRRNLSGLSGVIYSVGAFGPIRPIKRLDFSAREVVGASLLEYHVLLALANGSLHGYAIAERVAAESGGAFTPRAGSLYRVIARLVSEGLVAESEGEPDVSHPGLARRYYALTGAGRRTLAEEARRLKQVAAVAEKRLGLARGRS
jgi:DNA-binding PadR family transcriptional regulator